ncbi:hypothetical protein CANCADRAFT_58221 [Tortispora caseinolytica NRRL Y-17796]|uniref:Complement component 1 Q subcomponent-binding protein, mitochondrial n=1 Tax=Tortispora caseinolytica NRRL Y-17796 TaxID=767744 RepID=A0A1E4TBU9_9ASCO|nr:hypothetical protein CANCADRAFT_58221 [Tortispora caseinolytica NRRL Y-17796]
MLRLLAKRVPITARNQLVRAVPCAINARGYALASNKHHLLSLEKLVNKVKSELGLEKELFERSSASDLNEGIEQLKKHGFEVEFRDGGKIVTAKKSTPSEKVYIVASVDEVREVSSSPEYQNFNDDVYGNEDFEDMYEEHENTGTKNKSSKALQPNEQEPEELEDFDEFGEFPDGPQPPTPFSVVIEKPGSVLRIYGTYDTSTYEEESDLIDLSFSQFFDSLEEALKEDSKTGRSPSFDEIDNDVRMLLHEYVEELGITPEVLENFKLVITGQDQKDYIQYLEGLHSFLTSK